MGPDMLIMGGSYRARGRFARPICDLAFPIGSANPFGAARRPERPDIMAEAISDKKSLQFIVKKYWSFRPLTTIFAVVFVGVRFTEL
jgi:hypothetical protein